MPSSPPSSLVGTSSVSVYPSASCGANAMSIVHWPPERIGVLLHVSWLSWKIRGRLSEICPMSWVTVSGFEIVTCWTPLTVPAAWGANDTPAGAEDESALAAPAAPALVSTSDNAHRSAITTRYGRTGLPLGDQRQAWSNMENRSRAECTGTLHNPSRAPICRDSSRATGEPPMLGGQPRWRRRRH